MTDDKDKKKFKPWKEKVPDVLMVVTQISCKNPHCPPPDWSPEDGIAMVLFLDGIEMGNNRIWVSCACSACGVLAGLRMGIPANHNFDVDHKLEGEKDEERTTD